MPLPDYARSRLVQPLGLAEPSYERGVLMRTQDMARIGQMVLAGGQWQGRQVVPREFVAAATQRQVAGGGPVGMPFGYLWWIVPSRAPGETFMASGWSGQLIWVNRPLQMVVAITSSVSAVSQYRGHSVRLLREVLLPAALKGAGG